MPLQTSHCGTGSETATTPAKFSCDRTFRCRRSPPSFHLAPFAPCIFAPPPCTLLLWPAGCTGSPKPKRQRRQCHNNVVQSCCHLLLLTLGIWRTSPRERASAPVPSLFRARPPAASSPTHGTCGAPRRQPEERKKGEKQAVDAPSHPRLPGPRRIRPHRRPAATLYVTEGWKREKRGDAFDTVRSGGGRRGRGEENKGHCRE